MVQILPMNIFVLVKYSKDMLTEVICIPMRKKLIVHVCELHRFEFPARGNFFKLFKV